MTMTTEAKIKAKFRKTSKWMNFRKRMKKNFPKDAVTGKPLLKGWQLHHLDMSPEHYQVLKEENFACLNRQTHEVVHWLFRYKNWRELLQNLYPILEKMEELNNTHEKGSQSNEIK